MRPTADLVPVVVASTPGLAPVGDLVYVHVDTLLAEPHVDREVPWRDAAYQRLLVAAHGPVSFVAHPRLERAGVPHVAAPDPATLASARAYAYPTLAAVRARSSCLGSCAPSLVLVGEIEPLQRGYPLLSRAGYWLLRALRLLGHDELRLLLTNALVTDGHGGRVPNPDLVGLGDVLAEHAPEPPRWVVLGDVARRALRAVDVPPTTVVPHPAWHRRFRNEQGVAGYAAILEKAGVPRGPYAADAFANSSSGDPKAMPEAFRVPRQQRSNLGVRSRVHPGANRAREAEARAAFVTGACKSFKSVAERFGGSATEWGRLAADESWEVERESYQDRVREEALAKAASAEAAQFAKARAKTWQGLNDALDQALERIRQGSRALTLAGDAATLKDLLAVIPKLATPKDVQLLTDAALALSQHAPAGADEARGRLRGLTLEELKVELETTIRSQFGKAKAETPSAAPSTQPEPGNGDA